MYAANSGDHNKCLLLLKNGSVADIPKVGHTPYISITVELSKNGLVGWMSSVVIIFACSYQVSHL